MELKRKFTEKRNHHNINSIIFKNELILIVLFFFIFQNLCISKNNNKKEFKVKEIKIEKNIDIYTGLHLQGNTETSRVNIIPEIGIAKEYYLKINKYDFIFLWALSNEIIINKKIIWGFKTSPWISIMNYSFGLSFIYYTDFKKGNFKIRPEIGITINKLRIALGYNIPTIDNKALKALTDADLQLSLNYSFTIIQDFMVHVKEN